MDIAFEGIHRLALSGKSDGGDQSRRSLRKLFADIYHHRRTCAIGGLAESFLKAHLSGKCPVTVAKDTYDGNGFFEQTIHSGFTVGSITSSDFGHH